MNYTANIILFLELCNKTKESYHRQPSVRLVVAGNLVGVCRGVVYGRDCRSVRSIYATYTTIGSFRGQGRSDVYTDILSDYWSVGLRNRHGHSIPVGQCVDPLLNHTYR